MSGSGYLDLYDYRLRVAAMYRERDEALQHGEEPATVWERFWTERTRLFADHPQSALDAEQRPRFSRLRSFPYDARGVTEAAIDTDIPPDRFEVSTSGDEVMPMVGVARLTFRLLDQECALTLFWIDVYGGGLFLPFRDQHPETYGGGRYLVDTVKGSTFPPLAGSSGTDRVSLDFNYAYNPSCAYNHRWVCPLAPPSNRLPLAVPFGELASVEETA
jgi:uncharacterized protein (DUF1684 family)